MVCAGAGILVSCRNNSQRAQDDFIRFIVDYEKKTEPIDKTFQLSAWDYAQSGSTEDLWRCDSLRRLKLRVLHNAKNFQYLCRLKENQRIQDPYLSRQLDILYRLYRPCQADLVLQEEILGIETFLRLRLQEDMQDPEIRRAEKTLRYSKRSSELQEAWNKLKSRGDILQDTLLHLVALRNEQARQTGFDNYFQLRLFQDGICETFADSMADMLKQRTDEAYLRQKRELDAHLRRQCAVKGANLAPWHYRGHFLQNGMPACNADRDHYYGYVDIHQTVSRFFAGIGLPVDDILRGGHTSAQDGVSPFLQCFDIDRRKDIRIAGHPQGTENDMRQLLAVAGKACYYKYIPEALPYLLRMPSAPFLQEGVASFFGSMAGYSNWVLSMGLFSLGQAQQMQASYLERFRRTEIMEMRWALFLYAFEKSLYTSACDTGTVEENWRGLAETYMHFSVSSASFSANWAAEAYFSLTSVSAHNTFLGQLFASQLLDWFCTHCTRVGNPQDPDLVGFEQVGKHLQNHLFHAGASRPWPELVQETTGEALSAEAWLRDFVSPNL